jgi:hypothetical protein
MEISTCQPCAPATPAPRATQPEEAPGLGFRDLLGALNPLHSLPVIGAIYRHVTGATIHPAAQVIGGTIFGGPIGMFVSALSATFEQVTGKAPLTMALNAISPDRSADNAPLIADAATPFAGLIAEPEPQPEPAPNPVPPPQLAALQAQVAPAPRATAPQRAPAAAGEAAAPAAASRSVAPRSAALPETPPPPPAGASRPRIAGARDLAFYQAHAGARLPAAGGGGAPAHLAATPSAVPRAQARPAMEPPARAATPAPAPAPAPIATPAPATPPAAPAQTQADFASRMLQGLERYRAMTMAGDARSPALSLTR